MKGTIVDSTLITAPSSTKNKKKERDPEAHQVKKGNQWYFGYKGHIGVDRDTGLVNKLKTTAANVHDLTPVSGARTKSMVTAATQVWKSAKKSSISTNPAMRFTT